jgi:hypothetical protein
MLTKNWKQSLTKIARTEMHLWAPYKKHSQ